MMIFFTTLLILVGANALFMVFSLSGFGNKYSNTEGKSESSSLTTTDYPFSSDSTKFKKAG